MLTKEELEKLSEEQKYKCLGRDAFEQKLYVGDEVLVICLRGYYKSGYDIYKGKVICYKKYLQIKLYNQKEEESLIQKAPSSVIKFNNFLMDTVVNFIDSMEDTSKDEEISHLSEEQLYQVAKDTVENLTGDWDEMLEEIQKSTREIVEPCILQHKLLNKERRNNMTQEEELVEKFQDKNYWYVLHYDVRTTKYLNEIEFSNYENALKKFNSENFINEEDRIELIFSAEGFDLQYYSENIVVKIRANKVTDLEKL